MACITKTKTGKKAGYSIQFRDVDGRKRTLYGYLKESTARNDGEKIDRLVALLRRGEEVELKLVEWLETLPDSTYSKLRKWGLAPERVAPPTIRELSEIFLTGLQSVDRKPNTLRNRLSVVNILFDFFGAERPIHTITAKEALELDHFGKEKYAPATWGKNIRTVKQFFHYAVKEKWIRESPFADIRGANVSNPARFEFVSNETINRVLEACGNSQERLILCLARYGGLRIPSEIQYMEWEDIDFERKQFRVKSPKKETLSNQKKGIFTDKSIRYVPLFPELEKAFSEYFEDFPEGGPRRLFSMDKSLPKSLQISTVKQCVRDRFRAICRKAGIPVWGKFFQNLRSTRETELNQMQKFSFHEIARWIGHAPEVACRHYLQNTGESFRKASNLTTNSSAVSTYPSIEKGFDPSKYEVKLPEKIGTFLSTFASTHGLFTPSTTSPRSLPESRKTPKKQADSVHSFADSSREEKREKETVDSREGCRR